MFFRSVLGTLITFTTVAVPAPVDQSWRGPVTSLADNEYHFTPAVAAGGPDDYLFAFHTDTCADGCDEMEAVRVHVDQATNTLTFVDVNPIGVESLANSPNDLQAAGSNGDYLLVWVENIFLPPNTYPRRVIAALVDAGGNPSPLRVVSGADGEEDNPAVAGSTNGDFLVVWDDTEGGRVQGTGVYARLITAAGALAPAGGDLLLTPENGMPVGAETFPAVAWDGSRYVVSYTESDGTIWAVPVTVAGGEPTAGTAFQVSQSPVAGSSESSSIACTNAACLVVWEDSRNAATGWDLYGNLVTAAGAGLTDLPLVRVPGDQREARAAATAGDNTFMVVWRDDSLGLAAGSFDAVTLAPAANYQVLGMFDVDHEVATSTSGQYLIAHQVANSSPTDVGVALHLAYPNGHRCAVVPAGGAPDPGSDSDTCLSGFCVEGICCNTACDDICTRCSGRNSTEAAGICGFVVATSTIACREGSADGICDPPEYCDGANVDCPADVVQPNTFECRPAAARPTCDVAETCSGNPLEDCPSDQFAQPGVVCRPGSGDQCDPEESCTGGSNCPADVRGADGESCDPDTLTCNGVAACMGGMCVDPGPPACDDNDPCTTDTCVEPAGCEFTPIAGCRADAGFPDAAPQLTDGGPRPDVGPDEEHSSSSCNCGTVSRERNGLGLADLAGLFFACALLLIARRARSPSVSAQLREPPPPHP